MADIAFRERAPGRLFTLPWIFGPKVDLAVSIGGALAGFALLFMVRVLGWNVLVVWFVWVVLIDTPHFFASYFRTYLDKEERRTARRLLVGSLSVFLIGPAVIALCAALYATGVAQAALPWTVFINAVGVWAYWHITRQHYGILRLYNRKGGESGSEEAKLDSLVLYGCLFLSFIALLLTHPAGRNRLFLGSWLPIPDTIWTAPVSTLSAMRADQLLFVAMALGTFVLVARLVAFQSAKLIRGEPLNLPKLVFLASVLTLHIFMGFSGLLSANTILGFTAVVTIYHDIQYFTVVWFYAKNRYKGTQEERRRFGLAGTLAKSFPLFFAAGLFTISIPLWGLGCLINRVPVCASGIDFGPPNFMGYTNWVLLFAWLTSGFQMHHYVLDQFIWRPSRSASLRRDMKLESQIS